MDFIGFPVVNMREDASLSSKVVSQALFSEEVKLKEDRGDWALVITPDSYEGWVKREAILSRQSPFSPDLKTARLACHLYHLPDTTYGPLITLPFGIGLKKLDETDPRWTKVELIDGRTAYIQKGDLDPMPTDLKAFSKQFLGLPYTWGGRSSFGFDCSGFVQMIYEELDFPLLRDARQQITQGEPISLKELTLGDLLFWGKSESQILHVGMFLEGEEMIHTSVQENKPYLRLSKLSDFTWSGSSESIYPFRAARRYLASSQKPKVTSATFAPISMNSL